MKTIIVGAGEVGRFIGGSLTDRGHSVTLIDLSGETVERVDRELDVRALTGNGSSAEMLEQADVRSARNFLALTSDDRTNLVACKVAKQLGERVFAVARIHDQTYLDNAKVNYQNLFDVDFFLNPEMLCAVELAKRIRHPGRVAIEHFARGQIEVQNMTVPRRSKVAGRKIRNLGMDPRVRIGFVSGTAGTTVAGPDSVLAEGDQLTVFGKAAAVSDFRRVVETAAAKETARVVIFGGTEIGVCLLRLLSHPRFRIRIIEPDPQICEGLASRYPAVTVIAGDAGSKRLLEEEQVAGADHFIACTKQDEHNVMACLQAAQLGVGHVHLVINKPDYQDLLDDLREPLGLSSIVSPRQVSADELIRYLERDAVVELESMSVSEARLLEVAVSPDSSVIGRNLGDSDLSRHCVVVAILRGAAAFVPGAGDGIQKGDRILLAVDQSNRNEVVRRLTGKS